MRAVPITSLPARCVVLVLSACVDRGALAPVDDPPTDEIAVDTDRDTDTRVDDTDPPRRSCVPHELTWREQNAPRISTFGTGGIAWHPTTGLRIWGGCEVDRERALENGETGLDYLCTSAGMGPAESPWPVRAERWRDLWFGVQVFCMVRGDGSFACRNKPANREPPAEVQAAGGPGDYVDLYALPGLTPVSWHSREPRLWPWTERDRAPLATYRGHVANRKQGWLCVHDDHGGLTCEGPPGLEALFGDPERCWVEVFSERVQGLCALDDVGDVSCWSATPDWEFVLPPRGLSHLSLTSPGMCGLDDAGVVHCTRDRTELPLGDRGGFVDVRSDGPDVCALDSEGRVSCAGPGQFSFSFANPDAEPAEAP